MDALEANVQMETHPLIYTTTVTLTHGKDVEDYAAKIIVFRKIDDDFVESLAAVLEKSLNEKKFPELVEGMSFLLEIVWNGLRTKAGVKVVGDHSLEFLAAVEDQ